MCVGKSDLYMMYEIIFVEVFNGFFKIFKYYDGYDVVIVRIGVMVFFDKMMFKGEGLLKYN